jgi:hypothetical protein
VDYGQIYFGREDDSFDAKHMVTILDSEVDLAGRCAQITWQLETIPSNGSLSFHTYCYADTQVEY